jgi:YHS domain-containing protein
MVRLNQLARNVAFFSFVLFILQWTGSVLAGPCLRSSGLQYPGNHGYCCIPNSLNFGYFRTIWREWPGETRPERTFPQSIGIEEIPTPIGQQQLPAPKALELPGEPESLDLGEGFLPVEPPIEDGILPPEIPPISEPFLPDSIPAAPEEPGMSPLEPPPLDPPPLEPPPVEPPPLSVDPPSLSPPEPPSEVPLLTGPDYSAELPKLVAVEITDEIVDPPGIAEPEVPEPATAATGDDVVKQKESEEPELADPEAQLVAEEIVQQRELEFSKVSDVKPPEELTKPVEQTKPKEPQANWTAALHPGLRGDAPRAVVTYPSRGLARPVMHQTPVDPRSMPAAQSHEATRDTEQTARPAKNIPQGGSPPVALDGFCPIELAKSERWVPGNPRITAVHGGRTYLFSNTAQRRHFLSDPGRYTPMFSGEDPVFLVDGQCHVQGKTDYCVVYENRLYMFSSEDTLVRFQHNPGRYTKVEPSRRDRLSDDSN